jgi:hypothetical protein
MQTGTSNLFLDKSNYQEIKRFPQFGHVASYIQVSQVLGIELRLLKAEYKTLAHSFDVYFCRPCYRMLNGLK